VKSQEQSLTAAVTRARSRALVLYIALAGTTGTHGKRARQWRGTVMSEATVTIKPASSGPAANSTQQTCGLQVALVRGLHFLLTPTHSCRLMFSETCILYELSFGVWARTAGRGWLPLFRGGVIVRFGLAWQLGGWGSLGLSGNVYSRKEFNPCAEL